MSVVLLSADFVFRVTSIRPLSIITVLTLAPVRFYRTTTFGDLVLIVSTNL